MPTFQERLAEVLHTNPAMCAFLQDFCTRSFKTGDLPRRSRFRQVSPELKSDLRLIFGARAIKEQGDYFILDLTAAGCVEAEARRSLLHTLSNVLGLQPQNQRALRQQTHAMLLEKLQAILPSLRSLLPQKVHQRLTSELAAQNGYLWRDGVLKKHGTRALSNVSSILQALELLASREHFWSFSELGARVAGSSKSLRPGSELYRLAADWSLPFLENAENLLQIEDPAVRRARIWEQLGVEQSSAAITVMIGGPLVYEKRGQRVGSVQQYFEMGEPATLSLVQIAGLERIAPLFDTVLTVENLTPFVQAVEKPVLPQALIVYTEGFPNRAVSQLLRLCQQHVANLRFLHWGDTDLAGVRILRNLTSILGRAPMAFRCGPQEIARLQSRLIPLTPKAREQIVQDLRDHPDAPGHEILHAVLRYGGWLEQEAWETP
ncbi:MAG: Wadjet anti-phage system protein JetD domain-containing protein [bacterium]